MSSQQQFRKFLKQPVVNFELHFMDIEHTGPNDYHVNIAFSHFQRSEEKLVLWGRWGGTMGKMVLGQCLKTAGSRAQIALTQVSNLCHPNVIRIMAISDFPFLFTKLADSSDLVSLFTEERNNYCKKPKATTKDRKHLQKCRVVPKFTAQRCQCNPATLL